MCDGDLKCCLKSPEGIEPCENYGMLRRGQSPRAGKVSGVGFPGSQEDGGYLSAPALKGCEWEAHRKLPTGLDRCAQLSPRSPGESPEGNSRGDPEDVAFLWAAEPGNLLVIPALPISCLHEFFSPAAASRLLTAAARPQFQQPKAGDTGVAIAQLELS